MDQGFLGSPNGQFNNFNYLFKNKVECVFPMVIVSLLPQAELGQNDHREDAPHFIFLGHFEPYLLILDR